MKRWLLLAIFVGSLALCAALGLSLVTDSFLLFGTRRLADRNVRADLRLTTSGDREIKAAELSRRQAPLDIIFLGSSRTAFAFDPHSPTISRFDAYNAGLNGSHSNEMASILRFIVESGPKVRRIVWNIDFEEFFREAEPMGDFNDSAFAGRSLVLTFGRHALSYNALRKSVGGLFGAQPFYIDAAGFYHYELRDRAANLAGNDFVDMPTLDDWFPGYMVSESGVFERNAPLRLQAIVEAVRVARAKGVAVDIVMMPTHVARRAMFDAAGLQPQFEAWKAALAAALREMDAAAPVRILDFCEIHDQALTPFTRGGPMERSLFFFEVLHPRPIIGDMIVARLLDLPAPLESALGAPLEETSRAERMAADRDALRAWERDHPGLMKDIVATVRAHDKRASIAAR